MDLRKTYSLRAFNVEACDVYRCEKNLAAVDLRKTESVRASNVEACDEHRY